MNLTKYFLTIISIFIFTYRLPAEETHDHDHDHEENLIVLDDAAVKNINLQTAKVSTGEFKKTFFALGRLAAIPQNKSVLSSRIDGKIIESRVTVGQYVQKGDKLILLESRQPGDPPPSVWLTAPADGTVLSVNAVLGSPVTASDVICEMAELKSMYALATVPQQIAGKLASDTAADIIIPIKPDKKIRGQLLKFAACPCPDPACALGQNLSKRTDEDKNNTGNATIVFTIENPDNQLRPDINAEFSIILSKRDKVLSVPREALQGDALHRHVYVKDHDVKNAFIKTTVVTGETNQEMVEIVSGIEQDDEVATTGAYSLAFADNGNASLKETLDAAHGHEHNADGSEKSEPTTATDEHDHEHVEEGSSMIWKIIVAVLAIMLLVVSFVKKSNPVH